MTTVLAPPAEVERSSPPKSRRDKRNFTGWAFLGPFAVVFIVAFVVPILYALYLSFFRTQIVGGTSFVGFENYIHAFSDSQFWTGLLRVTLFMSVQVPVMLLIALFAALAIDSGRLHGMKFFRISIFMPYAVPAVVAALMWGFLYGTRFGLVGDFNSILGVNLPSPLSQELMLPALGNIVTWEFMGYNMLIFYAALRAVPLSLYEAAEIDGAGQFRIITAIKLPAIRGAVVIATIFSIIGSFQLFNEPNIIKELAPNAISSFYTPNMYAYTLAFSGQQINYSATVALIMGVITMAIAYGIQLRGIKEK